MFGDFKFSSPNYIGPSTPSCSSKTPVLGGLFSHEASSNKYPSGSAFTFGFGGRHPDTSPFNFFEKSKVPNQTSLSDSTRSSYGLSFGTVTPDLTFGSTKETIKDISSSASDIDGVKHGSFKMFSFGMKNENYDPYSKKQRTSMSMAPTWGNSSNSYLFSTDGISSIFGSSTINNRQYLGTWGCEACLARNPLNKSKCYACDTTRPNKDSEREKSYSLNHGHSTWPRNPMSTGFMGFETSHPRNLNSGLPFSFSGLGEPLEPKLFSTSTKVHPGEFANKSEEKKQEEKTETTRVDVSALTNRLLREFAKKSEEKKQEEKTEKDTCVDVSAQNNGLLNVNKSAQKLNEMLQSGKYSDATFNVKGTEFRLHRNIVAAHSSGFEALIDSGSSVFINDIDPEIFANLLHFMYTGSTDKLTMGNVVDMYTVAKTYLVPELSVSCVKFMIHHIGISLDNFCDVMSFSIEHHEDELYNAVTEYFLENLTDITNTVKWKTFLRQNPDNANSLFIKALDLKDKTLM